jgi:hypothetical protein
MVKVRLLLFAVMFMSLSMANVHLFFISASI